MESHAACSGDGAVPTSRNGDWTNEVPSIIDLYSHLHAAQELQRLRSVGLLRADLVQVLVEIAPVSERTILVHRVQTGWTTTTTVTSRVAAAAALRRRICTWSEAAHASAHIL